MELLNCSCENKAMRVGSIETIVRFFPTTPTKQIVELYNDTCSTSRMGFFFQKSQKTRLNPAPLLGHFVFELLRTSTHPMPRVLKFGPWDKVDEEEGQGGLLLKNGACPTPSGVEGQRRGIVSHMGWGRIESLGSYPRNMIRSPSSSTR